MGSPPTSVVGLQRELRAAAQALDEPGAGARANLECRMADLQQRLLTSPARSLDDVAAKLDVARELVAGLGPRGYLQDLLEATITDVRALAKAQAPD